MKLHYLLLLILAFLFILPNKSKGQEDSVFKPEGKIYGDLFLNANYNIDKSYASFRLNRLHFGYKYDFTENLYFNGMIESALEDYEPIPVGGDYNGITNLFEFCLGFNYGKLQGKFGLIGTEFNQQQEKLWKHRYVDKVFADKYGYAPTNDFGAMAIYKATDMLSFDVAITNGEGHKSLQADSAFRTAVGITVNPIESIVVRLYGDVLTTDTVQTNFIGILGYQTDDISVGLEYNLQLNSMMQDGYQRSGISAYGSYGFLEKYQGFARYDLTMSNKPNGSTDNWNYNDDGSLLIVGLQYQLIKQVTLALDYRYWSPDNSAMNEMSLLFFDVALQF